MGVVARGLQLLGPGETLGLLRPEHRATMPQSLVRRTSPRAGPTGLIGRDHRLSLETASHIIVKLRTLAGRVDPPGQPRDRRLVDLVMNPDAREVLLPGGEGQTSLVGRDHRLSLETASHIIVRLRMLAGRVDPPGRPRDRRLVDLVTNPDAREAILPGGEGRTITGRVHLNDPVHETRAEVRAPPLLSAARLAPLKPKLPGHLLRAADGSRLPTKRSPMRIERSSRTLSRALWRDSRRALSGASSRGWCRR